MSDIEWTPVKVKLGNLFHWAENPVTLTKAQAKKLLKSTEKLGRMQTLAIGPPNGNGKHPLYDGHQRVNVWGGAFGMDLEVNALQSSRPLTDDERHAVPVMLRTAMGSFDWDVLSSWPAEDLTQWGMDDNLLTDWKRDIAALGNLIESEKEPPEPPSGAVFSNEQIIDAAFEYFRKTGFPYRKLPIHVCMQEINKLAESETDKLLHSDEGYQIADTYHPHRFYASAEGMKSQLDSFNDDKLLRHALELEIKYGEIGERAVNKLQIVHGTQPLSNFRPGFALYLYRRLAPSGAVVLDTSTGYGGRLVGFMASGLERYIGIDPNKPTHDGNLKMAQDLGFADKVELYNLPAEDVDPALLAGRCDFAFTSPPYFAKEHYSDDDTQSWKRYTTGEAWRDGFLLPMMRLQYAALKDDSFSVVNIANVKLRNRVYPLVDWTIDAAKQCGFEFVKQEKFELTRRFGAGQADEVAFEPVLIFHKVDKRIENA